MIEHNKNYELLTFEEISFKIRKACCFIFDQQQTWVVELTVGRGSRGVDGWVFMSPEGTEVRFEKYPSMEPPGFLSGRSLRQGVEDSSLALLYDDPTEHGIDELEALIRIFLGKCRFCVRSLTEIKSGVCHNQALSYCYNATTITIS